MTNTTPYHTPPTERAAQAIADLEAQLTAVQAALNALDWGVGAPLPAYDDDAAWDAYNAEGDRLTNEATNLIAARRHIREDIRRRSASATRYYVTEGDPQ